jgi:competence protein ComEA
MDTDELRDRWKALEPKKRTMLVVAAVGVIAAVVWHGRSHTSAISFQPAAPRAASGAASATSSPSPAILVVDVTGLVHRPGVYTFHQGDRVVDAIRAAGGAKSGADLTSINLAALLTDAQQIVVGKTTGTGPVSSIGSGGASSSGSGATPVVNVNTATLDELEALPGIGPVLAQKIIDYRTQHGPFQSVNDLLNVSGIGDKRLADMKSQVTV